MTRRRLAFVAVAVAFSALAPWTASSVDAAQSTLGGFRGSASAKGLHAYYEPKGILPIAPPVDLGSPDALTTIATGPVTFARAGVADVGDLLANPDALFTLFSPDYPSGTIPPYPYRISANSSVGEPSAESNPAPGLNARVEAKSDGSHARAAMPGGVTPAIATIESSVSESMTKTDGNTVTVRAITRSTGFDLLGMLKIDSIITDLKATSAGVGTKLSGATKITGATFMGQKVTVDASGVHPDDNETDASRTGELNQLLANAGIRVSVAEPTQAVGGSGGQRGANGLRIDFEFSPRTFPAIAELADMLPPLENPAPGAPSAEDLIAVARARHLTAISVGGAQVSLEARSAAVFALPDVLGIFDDLLPSLEPTGSTSAFPDLAPSQGGAGVLSSAPSTRRAAASDAIPVGGSLIGLVFLALVVPPVLATRLSGAASTVLATGVPACERNDNE